MNYLCLDMGNVLVDLNLEPFRKAVSKQLNISKADADHFLTTTQSKQDIGITNIRDELVTHFAIKSEYILDDLMDAWLQVVKPNWDSIMFFNEIIEKFHLKTAILSNIGFEHAKMFGEKLKDQPVFADSIHHFSCEVGARKPTTLFFKTFLDMHPEFKGALYLDDIEANVEAGSRMGLSGRVYDLSCHFFSLGFDKQFVVEHFSKIVKNP